MLRLNWLQKPWLGGVPVDWLGRLGPSACPRLRSGGKSTRTPTWERQEASVTGHIHHRTRTDTDAGDLADATACDSTLAKSSQGLGIRVSPPRAPVVHLLGGHIYISCGFVSRQRALPQATQMRPCLVLLHQWSLRRMMKR